MLDEPDIDDETIAAIDAAEDEIEHGWGIDFNSFAVELRRKMSNQQ